MQITHNVMVSHPAGLVSGPGMMLNVPGVLQNAAGKKLQLVVRFIYSNGAMLVANPAEPSYRDASGFVATGTSQLAVNNNAFNLGGLSITVPYYALNIQATNGTFVHVISAVATVYVDNFVIAQSAPMSFTLRW